MTQRITEVKFCTNCNANTTHVKDEFFGFWKCTQKVYKGTSLRPQFCNARGYGFTPSKLSRFSKSS